MRDAHSAAWVWPASGFMTWVSAADLASCAETGTAAPACRNKAAIVAANSICFFIGLLRNVNYQFARGPAHSHRYAHRAAGGMGSLVKLSLFYRIAVIARTSGIRSFPALA